MQKSAFIFCDTFPIGTHRNLEFNSGFVRIVVYQLSIQLGNSEAGQANYGNLEKRAYSIDYQEPVMFYKRSDRLNRLRRK